jgi:hypothetical protein
MLRRLIGKLALTEGKKWSSSTSTSKGKPNKRGAPRYCCVWVVRQVSFYLPFRTLNRAGLCNH